MSVHISARLVTCCQFVHPGDIVADIGCDHGYLGIYLLEHNIASRVYACDIRPQPLSCAKRNAERFHLLNKMDFFLTDGSQGIPQDFNCMICAGIGADTIIHILESAPWIKSNHYRLILQCQSKLPTLRQYLYQSGFCIEDEVLVRDGRFIYSVISATHSEQTNHVSDWEYYVSKPLLLHRSPLLFEYVNRIIRNEQLSSASKNGNDNFTLISKLESILSE